MKTLTIEHYLDAFKYKTPCRITQLGIFNLDLEYPDERYYEIGVIEDLSTYESGKNISGSLKIKNGLSFDFDFKIGEEPEIKPLLYPLSTLTEFREDLGFVPSTKLGQYYLDYPNEIAMDTKDGAMTLSQFNLLYQWHIDIHGLIEQGLAIDKSKL